MNKMLDCNNLSGGEKQKMLEYLKKIKDSSIIIIISHDNEVLSNCDMIVTQTSHLNKCLCT